MRHVRIWLSINGLDKGAWLKALPDDPNEHSKNAAISGHSPAAL